MGMFFIGVWHLVLVNCTDFRVAAIELCNGLTLRMFF